jgi:hypothetical protein
MGRWRPPRKAGAKYITREGYDKLAEELRYLSDDLRPEVTKALGEAAAEGDRSENAEYIYRKKQLREIDSRLRFLMKRLDVLRLDTHKITAKGQKENWLRVIVLDDLDRVDNLKINHWLYIEGALKHRHWENKKGDSFYAHEVVATTFEDYSL